MPNWKKVIVSGSNAEVANLNAENYNLVPTGSGSVPELPYSIPFVTSGSVSSSIFVDNQSKLQWFPAGALEVQGNILAEAFITSSNVNASVNILSYTLLELKDKVFADTSRTLSNVFPKVELIYIYIINYFPKYLTYFLTFLFF